MLDLILTDAHEYQEAPCNKAAPLAQNDHCYVIRKNQYFSQTRRLVNTAANARIAAALAVETFQDVLSTNDANDKVKIFHETVETI